MNKIAIACQKGGVGKSTVATNLGVAFAEAGRKTAILDIDTQGTSFDWGRARKARGLKAPAVMSVNIAGLTETLEDLEERGCEVAIIDTRGAGDSDAAKAVRVSDFVLVPVQPSYADLKALGLTLDMIDSAHKEAFTFLNRVPPNGDDAKRAEDAIRSANGNISGIHLFERKTYKRAMGTGLSVMEWFNDKNRLDLAAISEVQRLYSFTVSKLGIDHAGD